MNNFNNLNPAQDERLAILAEELAESIQIVGKILRHGYDSTHPDDPHTTNKDYLEHELGHVYAILELMAESGDIDIMKLDASAKNKLQTMGKYLHHQPPELVEFMD